MLILGEPESEPESDFEESAQCPVLGTGRFLESESVGAGFFADFAGTGIRTGIGTGIVFSGIGPALNLTFLKRPESLCMFCAEIEVCGGACRNSAGRERLGKIAQLLFICPTVGQIQFFISPTFLSWSFPILLLAQLSRGWSSSEVV